MIHTLRLGIPALILAMIVGCGAQDEPTALPTDAPATPPAPAADADAAASAVKLSDDEIATIKELESVDDQAAAMAQAVCPVSEEHLGSMGAPISATIGDRTFFLCCKGCEKGVSSDPDKVIAKLDELAQK